jgi:hypothetical protein
MPGPQFSDVTDPFLVRLLTDTALNADLESAKHGSTLCPKCDSDMYFATGSDVPEYGTDADGERTVVGWIPAARRCAHCNYNTIYQPGSKRPGTRK